MPLGIGHFAVGVVGGVLILLGTGWHRRISQDGYVVIMSGLWALVPELGQVFDGVPQTDNSMVANVFWFHSWLDHNSFFDSMEGTVVLGALMVLSLGWLVLVKRIQGEKVAPVLNRL